MKVIFVSRNWNYNGSGIIMYFYFFKEENRERIEMKCELSRREVSVFLAVGFYVSVVVCCLDSSFFDVRFFRGRYGCFLMIVMCYSIERI